MYEVQQPDNLMDKAVCKAVWLRHLLPEGTGAEV